ncbi:hypothetical protein NE573_24335, partial [Parabacteroides distasonis]
LYGSRAANGVIVITTKSGKKGDGRNFSISYSGNVQSRVFLTCRNCRTHSDKDGTVRRLLLRMVLGAPVWMVRCRYMVRSGITNN